MKILHPIAYYLPQYHPIPENDKWWGKGFTEWTNVTKAKPLFPGHKQPHFPADLGYYDLRVPEVREQQAELARKAGIEGFCYWHYWFGNGKRLLERPFDEVLTTGKPDFPFCLAWANESWSGIWHGAKDRILIKQEYYGLKDYEKHFYELLPAFLDDRYIKVEGKPLFVIYNPLDLPNMQEFCGTFKNLALKNNLNGIFLIANSIDNRQLNWDPELVGFDAYTISGHNRIIHNYIAFPSGFSERCMEKIIILNVFKKLIKLVFNKQLIVYDSKPKLIFKYEEALKYFLVENKYKIDSYPTIITGWDNTPRCGKNGLVLTDFTPEKFRVHLKQLFPYLRPNKNKIVFIKSWNEWAEGNYIEPEIQFRTQFLDVLKEELEILEQQVINDFK